MLCYSIQSVAVLFDAVAGDFAAVALVEVAFLDSEGVFDWDAPASFTVSFDTDTVVLTFVVSFATVFSLFTVTVEVDAVTDVFFSAETFAVFGTSLASAGADAAWVAGAFTVCSTVGVEVAAAVLTGAVVGAVVVFD